MDIYGTTTPYLPQLLDFVMDRVRDLSNKEVAADRPKLYEHLIGRVKAQASMEEKCRRKGYPVTPESALTKCKDAIGIRVVCNFIDDVYRSIDRIKAADWCTVVEEKDYIENAKPNGYRSYHLTLDVPTDLPDYTGHAPSHYFVEIQLRTIAMDSWASLEHEMKYKHHVNDPERIEKELRRCADQLASCDVQMQTIRQLINESN